MAGKRDFSTVPTRLIRDQRPSALDLRVLACVSMHDGMSLKKGKGRGCYATFATLTAEVDTDASNLSKSLRRLVEWGYLTEERQDDRRRKTYRVIFDAEEGWRNDQQSHPQEVGETTNGSSEIVGNDERENGGNPLLDGQHYSSLKGLDTLEREKLDSDESARFAARRLSKIEFAENIGGQLARFERAWKERPEDFTDEQLVEWHTWLAELSEESDPDDPTDQRAQRLYYDVDVALWETNRGPYAGEAAA